MFLSESVQQRLLKLFVYLTTIFLVNEMLNIASPYYSVQNDPLEYNENDHYTSMVGLEKLFHTETTLLEIVHDLPANKNPTVSLYTSELHEIEKEHLRASAEPEEYLNNPINSYLLIKRLHKFWHPFLHQADIVYLTAGHHITFPTPNDNKESVLALVRLQETYKFKVSDIASGILNGVNYGTSMSWHDCFYLGQQLARVDDYNHARPWLKEAVNRFYAAVNSSTLKNAEDLAKTLFLAGEYQIAMNLSQTLIKMQPNRDAASLFQKKINEIVQDVHIGSYKAYEKNANVHCVTDSCKKYDKICRGEIKPPLSQETPLRCRYFHRNEPYRLLMPFKLEEISLGPYVILVHNVLSDYEINTITELSKLRMKRPQNDGTPLANTEDMISKNAWFKYDEHLVLGKLLRKLLDITGLSMTKISDLQVSNYGIGGHTNPHYDFGPWANDVTDKKIASSIFFLSKIEHGGDTVFFYLKKAVSPEKGSMLFWYNYDRNLLRDIRTKHAGCPVGKGSKWTANIWLSANENTFRGTCDVNMMN